jgi:hypothetical protein
MKKTLQDQYLLIKEGKGHKGVFLAEAKRNFPQYVPNAATFEEAAASLKTKNIISENIVGLSVVAGYEPKKKESYETAFEAFLAEAKKKKENEDEKVKAEEKKVSKPVEKDLEKQFDNKDDKNLDNLIFDQVMTGYYAEMKDPKNADKTMQQLKDMVIKNLSKDPIHYTKDGQFGVKGLGYVTEAPGLGEPKEAKGKWKSSGYGDLNEAIGRNYPGEIEGEYQGKPMDMPGIDLYDLLKDMLNIATSEDDFVKKVAYGITDKTSSISKETEFKLRNWYKRNSSNNTNEAYEPDINTMDELDLKSKLYSMGVTPIVVNSILSNGGVEGLRNALKDRLKDRAIGLNESKLRKIIREMVDNEMEELTKENAGPASYNNPKAQGGGGGRRYIPTEAFLPQETIDKLNFSNPGENTPTRDESLQIPHIKFLNKPDGSLMLISNFLYNDMQGLERGRSSREKEMGKNELEKLISDIDPMVRAMIKKNVDPKMSFGNYHAVNMPIEREKGVGVKIPISKEEKKELEEMMLRESLLKEGVEKELAAINKEAEHEILQSKLDKVQELIDRKQSQISKLDEDEDMKALTDKKKVKEIEKDIKSLEKAKSKIDKMMGKHKGKKKEVIDEDEPIDEAEGDPVDVNKMNKDLATAKKTMTDMSKIEIFEEEPEGEY